MGRSNDRGTVLIESALVSVVLFPILIGASALFYGLIAKSLCDRNAYEALICSETKQSPSSCESHFLNQLDTLLPFGKVERFKVQTYSQTATAHYSFRFSESLEFSNSVSIPHPLTSND